MIHTLTLYKFRPWFCQDASLPFLPHQQEKPEQHNTTYSTKKRSDCDRGQRIPSITNKSLRPQPTRQIRTSRQHQSSEDRPMPAQSDIFFVLKASWPNLDKLLTLSCTERMCTWWYQRLRSTFCHHTFGETELRTWICQVARNLGGYGYCGDVRRVADVSEDINMWCDVCQPPN